MKQLIVIPAIILLVAAISAAGQRVDLGTTTGDVFVTVLESNENHTVARFEIGGFYKQAVDISGETYYSINLVGEGVLHNQGEPALPRICRSFIIPDNAKMEIRVELSEYREFTDIPVIPSKGNLKRTVNPADVPYEFGPIYFTDDWYPSAQASVREPYILRDVRGIVAEVYPFQYNPVTKTLRVYTSITIELVNSGPGEINVLDRHEPLTAVTPEFDFMYRRRFINYGQSVLLYTPVGETGDMLVITHDAFHDAVMPFVEWKRQKGIKTTLVNISTIGNNANSIKNFVQAFYDSTNLAFLVLVGDAAQVATYYASDGASDPSYSKVAGSDSYPDIFVGRISAENLTQVETQITRLVEYEETPQTSGNWYHLATGIASNQGPGHQGEYDNQHMGFIRNDLLAYNYTSVDQIYDPNASAAQVTQVLNEGRGFVNYCGHGSWDSWGTTDFSNSLVNALTNDNKLPFVFSVACNNGEFDNYASCYAETWMRATNNGEPTGAVGVYMSSISQDWDPPMWAQDEAVDLLVAEAKLTFGGICYNGSCKMIDETGSDGGIDMFNTWILFGDPSALIYTDTPSQMTVQHDPSVIFTSTDMDVTIYGVEGALCALYYDGVLYGSAYTDNSGLATIVFDQTLPVGVTLDLTATCYNRAPYFGAVTAIAPDGPYVVFDEYGINDDAGNANGLVDFSESILLDVQLMNVGPDMAYGVSGTLTSADDYVTITDNTAAFGNIEGDFGTTNLPNAFGFDVSSQAPDGHIISFDLTATNGSLDWVSHFTIPVHAPVINFIDVSIDDSDGNGNGILEAGETVDVRVTIKNTGSSFAGNVTGVIDENDEYVTVVQNYANFGNFDPGEIDNNSINPYIITAESNYPPGHSVLFDMTITADNGYTADLQFTIRAMESFEYDNAGWTAEGVWEWGQPASGPGSAYDGTNVWATSLGANYPNNASDGLMTTYCTVTNSVASLSFWHWYDLESGYDGGNLKVTTDGGATWQLIQPTSGYPESNISALDEPGYSGQSGGWQEVNFDLGEFESETIKIKFNFASDYTVTDPGWYIDAVIMTGVINWGANESNISIDQQCINAIIDDGDIETHMLGITNTGQGILEFTAAAITDDRSVAVVPDNGTAPAIDERYFEKDTFNGITSYNYIGPKADSDSPSGGDIITDFGGPDEFGYTWKDSNEPNGPLYEWIDITGVGTPITGFHDDTNLGPFEIGFDFPFYGNMFSSFRACSNGWLSFTSSATTYSNASIPSGSEPYNLVAPFWDDLTFSSSGAAYYYSNGVDSLVVSYISVPHYGSTGPYTFQVILLGNGDIFYQYADINAPVDSYAMGIQNANGTIGLQMANNQAYAEPGLAVKIHHPIFWLTVSPTAGALFPDETMYLNVTFDATEVEQGLYTGNILINSNDPDNPSMTVPCTLNVIPVGIADNTTGTLPTVLALDQNYPNPFNPKTEIWFGLPSDGQVNLEVYDIMGRRVSTLINEKLAAGTHQVIWDGKNDDGLAVSSGMYFYKLTQDDNVITRKMMMLK